MRQDMQVLLLFTIYFGNLTNIILLLFSYKVKVLQEGEYEGGEEEEELMGGLLLCQVLMLDPTSCLMCHLDLYISV